MHLLLFPVQEREISKGLEGGAAAARGDTLLLLTMAERSKRSKVCLHFTRANADNTHWHKYKKRLHV